MDILTIVIIGIAIELILVTALSISAVIRRLNLPDFRARPTAARKNIDTIVPDLVGDFQRIEGPTPTRQGDAWTVLYQGLDGVVHLSIFEAPDEAGAVNILARVRRQGKVRLTLISLLVGDRSVLVQRKPAAHLVAWTNAQWAFVTRGRARSLLITFAERFPY